MRSVALSLNSNANKQTQCFYFLVKLRQDSCKGWHGERKNEKVKCKHSARQSWENLLFCKTSLWIMNTSVVLKVKNEWDFGRRNSMELQVSRVTTGWRKDMSSNISMQEFQETLWKSQVTFPMGIGRWLDICDGLHGLLGSVWRWHLLQDGTAVCSLGPAVSV